MERLNEEFVYLEKQERHLKNLLPIKFPTFIAEVKLDGERMIVHVQRGVVTMHTRQGKGYSRLYSPIIAPDIRNALAEFDVDVILDGEMIAWDNIDKENILFGKNKTVAKMRRKWCSLNGLIDECDLNLHTNVENHVSPAAAEE
jgi:ATP-dependent DNA ligase